MHSIYIKYTSHKQVIKFKAGAALVNTISSIVECTLLAIVFSVNTGKVINTRREVVEAVS